MYQEWRTGDEFSSYERFEICVYRFLGVRMLDGQATDALEARALGFKSDYVDIYINCWGPKDDGKTFGKPGPIAARALKEGAENVNIF